MTRISCVAAAGGADAKKEEKKEESEEEEDDVSTLFLLHCKPSLMSIPYARYLKGVLLGVLGYAIHYIATRSKKHKLIRSGAALCSPRRDIRGIGIYCLHCYIWHQFCNLAEA